MNCPYCDKEMQKGIIIANAKWNVVWKAVDEHGIVNDENKVKLSKFAFFGPYEIEAFYCGGCQKMIIDMENIPQ
ncbi:MAG: hypothetical protein HDT43_02700 [Ruminococcaceae bacterium]|nr:hypothetical protein [Oscillospiraceae bacterium]